MSCFGCVHTLHAGGRHESLYHMAHGKQSGDVLLKNLYVNLMVALDEKQEINSLGTVNVCNNPSNSCRDI